MIRKVLSIAMALLCYLGVNAQAPQLTPMPLNPDVKHGVLPNGLNYYILHNEEPKERANFYIAQKVGSSLETPEQLGLAHFLEHMAFNGTKNFPGKNMLNYLQSKGIRFGSDINAYTGFDETVYRLNNIPTTDKALMDSVLLVLHDWSGSILLEEDEINAERGVIEEEWRSSNSAQNRMFEAVLPQIYDEYQYEQTPIGKMEVVRNFPPQAIRDYYKKWYRPDQQGIVIVGDFDVAEMEQKVIALFSEIPMPENAAAREYPSVSDNEELKFAYFEDPELPSSVAYISFKYDKTPFEFRNTVEMFVQDEILLDVLATLINNRLDEYSKKAECKYAYAGASFGDFWVSKTKGSLQIIVIAKDDIMDAVNDAMAIVARACKTGFTDSELSRVRDEIISNYEKAYNERNKTNNDAVAQELIRNFIDNNPAPGKETEYTLVSQVLPGIPVQLINQLGTMFLKPNNQVVVISRPSVEGQAPVMRETVISSLQTALDAQYEAYVDEIITDPLIAKLPKPGKIKATSENAQLGTTTFTLSNGAKVVVKPTDFASDEIILSAFKNGGKRSYPETQAANVQLIEDAYNLSKLGKFDVNTLKKYLAGKKVSLSFEIANTVDMFSGKSTVKDLPTLMELLYASFTDLNPDETTYQVQIDQIKPYYANLDKNPDKIFQDNIAKTRYGNNPMMNAVTLATIEAASYPEMVQMIKNATANAADYTFVFTGNIDVNTLKPLLEQYVATLPSKSKKSAVKEVTSISLAQGQQINEFTQPMQTPATKVFNIYSGKNVPFSIANSVKVQLIGDILGIIFTETLREEEGGTYSPHASAYYNANTGEWIVLYLFQTNKEQQEKILARANEEAMKLFKEGTNDDYFNKVKEAALKQYEIQVKTNKYWDNGLVAFERGYDTITGHAEAISNLTLKDLNDFMKNLYDGKNRILVVMEGTEAK